MAKVKPEKKGIINNRRPNLTTVEPSLFDGQDVDSMQKKPDRQVANIVEQVIEEKLESTPPPKPRRKTEYLDAEGMAKKQRDISISEFFAKNRHLLGFDNPRKALLTTIKEAVDNSLDACEESGILPDITVIIKEISEERYEVTVEDNGPGIVKAQVPHIFGRLLYGSKFHNLKMARGQQGIGISAAGMYGVLTTGKPIRVTSRIGAKKPAHYYELAIDTKKNRPDIIKEDEVEFPYDHGTRVTIELQAKYQRGKTSVDEYLRQTAIANPHASFLYTNPAGELAEFKRSSDELPPQPKTIKPHPYGVELGILIKMLQDSDERSLHQFLTKNFSRVSARVADEIIKEAKLSAKSDTHRIGRTEADRLFQAINRVKIPQPATDCIVPIGEDNLLKGLQSIIKADFYTASTRPPAVYRGNPFVIEVALAYGKPEESQSGEQQELTLDGKLTEEQQIDKQLEQLDDEESEMVRLMRFANRVPLLYQHSACAMYKSMVGTNWRLYGLQQSKGALPTGQAAVMIHIASVWVPFTSESKEAIAHYPEIIKEIKLAIQECGRKLGRYLKHQNRVYDELKKRSYIEKYIPHIGIALKEILGLSDTKIDKVVAELKDILERSRKM
ncbi:MAG: DNA topoisomerase VI subunit B [Phycisphaerae bacterium]